ncbi:MAG: hypothetical protein AAGA91_04955 [Pseudomonadota bacterium]
MRSSKALIAGGVVISILAAAHVSHAEVEETTAPIGPTLLLSGNITPPAGLNLDDNYTVTLTTVDGQRVMPVQEYAQTPAGFFMALPASLLDRQLTVSACYASVGLCLENTVDIASDFVGTRYGSYAVELSVPHTQAHYIEHDRQDSSAAYRLALINDVSRHSDDTLFGSGAMDYWHDSQLRATAFGKSLPYLSFMLGTSALMCTHMPDDIQDVCETLGLIDSDPSIGYLRDITLQLDRIEDKLAELAGSTDHVKNLIIGLANLLTAQQNNQAYNYIAGVYSGYANVVNALGGGNPYHPAVVDYLNDVMYPVTGGISNTDRITGLFDPFNAPDSIRFPQHADTAAYFEASADEYYDIMGFQYKHQNSAAGNPDYRVVTPDLHLVQSALFTRINEGLAYWADLINTAVYTYKTMPPGTESETVNLSHFAALNALDIEQLNQSCLSLDSTGEACEDALFERITERAEVIKDVYLNFAGLPGSFLVRDNADDAIVATVLGTSTQAMDQSTVRPLIGADFLSAYEPVLPPAEEFDDEVTQQFGSFVLNWDIAGTDGMAVLYSAFTPAADSGQSLSAWANLTGGAVSVEQLGRQQLGVNNTQTSDGWIDTMFGVSYSNSWTQQRHMPNFGQGTEVHGFWSRDVHPGYRYYLGDDYGLGWNGDVFHDSAFYNELLHHHTLSTQHYNSSGSRTFWWLHKTTQNYAGRQASEYPTSFPLQAFGHAGGCHFQLGTFKDTINPGNAYHCMDAAEASALLVTESLDKARLDNILFNEGQAGEGQQQTLYCPAVEDLHVTILDQVGRDVEFLLQGPALDVFGNPTANRIATINTDIVEGGEVVDIVFDSLWMAQVRHHETEGVTDLPQCLYMGRAIRADGSERGNFQGRVINDSYEFDFHELIKNPAWVVYGNSSSPWPWYFCGGEGQCNLTNME